MTKFEEGIVFIDFKRKIKNIEKNLPCPIFAYVIKDIIRNKEEKEDIKLIHIYEAMAYIVEEDENFLYCDQYRAILENTEKLDLLLYDSIFDLCQKDKISAALILARYLKNNFKIAKYNILYVELNEKKNCTKDSILEEDIVNENLKILEEAAELGDESAQLYFKLYLYYRYTKDYIRSYLSLKKAIKAEEDSALKLELESYLNEIENQYYNSLSAYYIHLKRYDKAHEILEKALEKYDDGEFYYRLSYIYSIELMHQEALDLAIKAVEHCNSPYYMDQLAISNYNCGNTKEAIRILKKMIDNENVTENTKNYYERMLENQSL